MSYDPEQTVTFKDISMPAADALCALYDESRPQGLGIFHFTPGKMNRAKAAEFLTSSRGHTDYVQGRVIKVSFEGELRLGLYDRDMGDGAGERALRDYMDANIKTEQD